MSRLTGRRAFLSGLAVTLLAGRVRADQYQGPKVTRVVVQKAQRRLYLMHENKVLRSYKIELGFDPVGPKRRAGDGKTPEGSYFIDRRNPNSSYYLSLGISYPNARDVAEARKRGVDPGGDIFIHGGWRGFSLFRRDWTAGCISVSNRAMEEIYSMVELGTQIDINP